MTIFGRAIGAMCFTGALLLGGCGGTGADSSSQLSSSTLHTPTPAPDNAAFISMATTAECSDTRNRLFVIDQQLVFLDRAGNCPDNSYAQVLYGAAPQDIKCFIGDTIAGPRTFCNDDEYSDLFQTMLNNLDKADLGLGASHQVELLMSSVPFESIDDDKISGMETAQNLVVKDAATWSALWAEHKKYNVPPPPVPEIDFSRKMVIAVFMGQQPGGCYSTTILDVYRSAGKLHVLYGEAGAPMGAMCTAVITAPSQLILIDRSDEPVEFSGNTISH